MKKKPFPFKRFAMLLFVMATLLTTRALATQRSLEEMTSIAYAAFNLTQDQPDPFAVQLLGMQCKSSDLLDASLFENNGEAFFIFAFTNNAPGYVIVSADTRLPEVLAFSDSEAFRVDRMPVPMLEYLRTFVQKMNDLPDTYVAKRRTRGRFFAKSSTSVEPLLGEIAFNQNEPFNNACPIYDGKPTLTGCVATAMSQVMRYYKYPAKMKGDVISYTTETNQIPVIWDCSSTSFDWAKIRETYFVSSPSYTANETVVDRTYMTLTDISFDEDNYVILQNFWNMSGEDLSFKVQFIVTDNQGRFLRPVSQSDSYNSLGNGYFNPSYHIYPSFPFDLSDGTYRLYMGIQLEGTSQWSYVQKGELGGSFHEEFFLMVHKQGSYFTIQGSDYHYPCGYSDEEAAEVAKLHAASGATVEMDYREDESSASIYMGCIALIKHFSYDQNLEEVSPSYFNEENWHKHLQNELNNKRPVIFDGGGHAFVVDGYRYDNSTPYYHVNWGWGGYCNAYFLLDKMQPSEAVSNASQVNYSYDYTLFCAIQPEDNIDTGRSLGCSSYSVDKTTYSGGETMRLTITSSLKNCSMIDFNGDIKAYACSDSRSYELEKVRSLNLGPNCYTLYQISANLTIPTTIPTGSYRIVLKSKTAGSSVEKEVYSPENPVVQINNGSVLLADGDVNRDGKVDKTDVDWVANYILGKNTNSNVLTYGDMDDNGEISISDLTAIIELIP